MIKLSNLVESTNKPENKWNELYLSLKYIAWVDEALSKTFAGNLA